jgi:multicomponent Na+:H+ antiporter subunit B
VTRRVRIAILVPALAALAVFVVWGFTGLLDFGTFQGQYGKLLNRVAVPQRHTTNVISAIVWDYRGIDTLGEEFILFTAVLGCVLLLREQTDDVDERDDAVESEALRAYGLLSVGVVFLVGLWLAAFGTATPGGGFQGGVVLAGAIVLVYAVGSHRSWSRVTNEHFLEPFEASGVGTYTVVGLIGLAAAGTYLHNLLSPGKQGTLLGGGSIVLLNWATAIEVVGALVLLFREFLQAYRARRASCRTRSPRGSSSSGSTASPRAGT